ncbi:MAG: hypothetical protein R2733_04990 [Acidimicrobiales bacterium]
MKRDTWHVAGAWAAGGAGILWAMAAPGKKLSDDLYSLYLAAITWMLLPVYGNGLALVLPSDVSGFERTLDVMSALAVVGSAWVGFRGGPFLVNRAGVLHELQSPRPLRRSLLPRLMRQGVAYAALGAIVVTVLLAMSDAESFGFAEAGRSSLVAMLAMAVSVCTAVGWLVVFKGSSPHRVAIAVANLVIAAPVIVLVATDISLASGTGFAVLFGALATSAGVAAWALDAVPLDHLWRRATALEDMRSAMLSFDFQQVLVSLRRAIDQTEGRTKAHLARPWMPLQLWRYLATVEHGWHARLAQFVVAVGATALILQWTDPADGVIALSIAGLGFLLGVELSSPVAATTGQLVFLVHYRRPSSSILRRQTATALALASVLGLVAVGWELTVDAEIGLGVLVLFVFGTLAAAAQGRLGSPDLAQMASVLGPSGLGPALWARAFFGPTLVLALTIVVSHGWLHPDPSIDAPWPTLVATVVIAGAVVATYPLEKRS